MAKGRRPVVVDVNVPITANHRGKESYACANACAQALLGIRRDGRLLLDQHDAIFDEYRRYLNFHGQPGVGDKFFKWFVDNRGRTDLCEIVELHRLNDSWRVWHEFPDDERVSDFDPSDQKFIAVASAYQERVEILQASDHKWLKWGKYLAEHGFQIVFLCEAELVIVAANKRK